MSVGMSGHIYVCQYVCTALYPSICPLQHLGDIYVFVRHPDIFQYNYLFICPVVVCRLTIVYRAYLIKIEGTGGSMWQCITDVQQP